jgi:para-nitrobenzyl esterase
VFAKEVADETEVRAALTRRFGAANVDPILAHYPLAAFPTPNRALAEVSGDAFFVCPTRRAARGTATAGSPTYVYSFEKVPDGAFLQGLGSFHTAELPFVFGNPDGSFPLARVGPATDLATAVQRYWTQLARTGIPDGDVAWPMFDTAGDRHLLIGDTATASAGNKRALCDFWDALVVPF